MDLKFWKMRKALVAVAKKLMRAKAGLKRLQVETQRNPRRMAAAGGHGTGKALAIR